MIEEVLKFNIMILNNNRNYLPLSEDEIRFLSSWEAEKFRKNLKS